jgi:hypothetical protein
MKKLFLPCLLIGVALLFGPSAQTQTAVGPTNLITCNRTATASPATATTTALFQAAANQSINICGWHVTSNQSASTTFQFAYGAVAGGPCASPTMFTPAFSVTSTAPSADRQEIAYFTIPGTAAGTQMCVISTGATVGLAVMVWYAVLP